MKRYDVKITDNNLPLVLTIPETARSLRVGTGRCYELARCGRLRSIRVGKRILVPRDAIFEFLEAAEEQTQTEMGR